uniref:Putative secreted protein n=1 Tax=Ixodes ricinus TaxID=34613 RepID=A0A6B0UKZ1_IXORI
MASWASLLSTSSLPQVSLTVSTKDRLNILGSRDSFGTSETNSSCSSVKCTTLDASFSRCRKRDRGSKHLLFSTGRVPTSPSVSSCPALSASTPGGSHFSLGWSMRNTVSLSACWK